MARAINGGVIVIDGTEAAPTGCECDYVVRDGELHEPPKEPVPESEPNWNQTVTAMCAAVLAGRRTAEGV